MKLKKTILVIDDKDQAREIENIQEELNDRFEITYFGIWTAQPQFRKDGSNDPDIDKIRSAIKTYYDRYHHFD